MNTNITRHRRDRTPLRVALRPWYTGRHRAPDQALEDTAGVDAAAEAAADIDLGTIPAADGPDGRP